MAEPRFQGRRLGMPTELIDGVSHTRTGVSIKELLALPPIRPAGTFGGQPAARLLRFPEPIQHRADERRYQQRRG